MTLNLRNNKELVNTAIEIKIYSISYKISKYYIIMFGKETKIGSLYWIQMIYKNLYNILIMSKKLFHF